MHQNQWIRFLACRDNLRLFQVLSPPKYKRLQTPPVLTWSVYVVLPAMIRMNKILPGETK